MMNKKVFAIICAILAAVFYALSIPLSKKLLVNISSTSLAGLLYLGAGIGMSMLYGIKLLIRKVFINKKEINNDINKYESFTKKDIKYIILMVVLDIVAPICLLFAVDKTNSSTVSLLNNFEIVMTSIIAFFVFKEKINLRTLIAIILITIASILLTVDFSNSFKISIGAIFALIACCSWGLENNCTRNLSSKNPYLIVIIKGFGSGLSALVIGIILKDTIGGFKYVVLALLLGFISYGLSVFTYVLAQKYIGASKTSCYYAIAPFVGVLLAFVLFKENINYIFYIALGIMIIGTIIISVDTMIGEKKE